MGKLKEVGVRIIKKVAKARKATPIEQQNLEDEFNSDHAEFVEKYREYLNEEEIQFFRDLI